MGGGGATERNWTETVEDLEHDGEVVRAIAFLESTISKLENKLEEEEVKIQNGVKSSSFIADQLSTALKHLSRLCDRQGFSLRADQAYGRAVQIDLGKRSSLIAKESISNENAEARDLQNEATDDVGEHGYTESSSNLHNDGFPQESSVEDDWETIADRAPEKLRLPPSLPGVSKLSLEDSKEDSESLHVTKRRGRGTFSYKKQGLYSDNQPNEPDTDDSEKTFISQADDHEKRNSIYGTRHVLVLSDVPPSTRTTDLEKLLEKFKDRFVIHWVNDTTALAVFGTPSVALEALNSIQCSFTVHVLDEDYEILSRIQPRDLEPPRQRPKTSARTAQRLIAQGMGIRLPSTFGSDELRRQEEARKNRIVLRQNKRDDAWGSNDPK